MGLAHRLPFQKKSLRIWGLSDRLARRFPALVFFSRRIFFDISGSVAGLFNSSWVVEVITTHFSSPYQSLLFPLHPHRLNLNPPFNSSTTKWLLTLEVQREAPKEAQREASLQPCLLPRASANRPRKMVPSVPRPRNRRPSPGLPMRT